MVYTGFLRLKIELYYQILDFLSHIILLFLYFKDMIGMIGQSQYTESISPPAQLVAGLYSDYRYQPLGLSTKNPLKLISVRGWYPVPNLLISTVGAWGRAGVSISRFPALPPYQPVFPPGGIVGEGI